MSLIDKIEKAMLSDDEDRDKQSEILRSTYEEQSREVRNVIDECFISLCGWSLETLLNRS